MRTKHKARALSKLSADAKMAPPRRVLGLCRPGPAQQPASLAVPADDSAMPRNESASPAQSMGAVSGDAATQADDVDATGGASSLSVGDVEARGNDPSLPTGGLSVGVESAAPLVPSQRPRTKRNTGGLPAMELPGMDACCRPGRLSVCGRAIFLNASVLVQVTSFFSSGRLWRLAWSPCKCTCSITLLRCVDLQFLILNRVFRIFCWTACCPGCLIDQMDDVCLHHSCNPFFGFWVNSWLHASPYRFYSEISRGVSCTLPFHFHVFLFDQIQLEASCFYCTPSHHLYWSVYQHPAASAFGTIHKQHVADL